MIHIRCASTLALLPTALLKIILFGFGILMNSLAMAADNVAIMMPAESTGGQDQYLIYLATGIDVEKVTVCVDTPSDRCAEGTAGAVRTSYFRIKNDRKVFQAASSISFRHDMRLSVVGWNSSGQKIATADVLIQNTTRNDEQEPDLSGNRVKLEQMSFQIPDGWKVHQDAAVNGILILGLTNGRDYLRIYVQQGSKPDMNQTFVNNNARITKQPHDVQYGAATWTLMETSKDQRQVAAFAAEKDGLTYWGFATSASGGPGAVVQTLLQSSR